MSLVFLPTDFLKAFNVFSNFYLDHKKMCSCHKWLFCHIDYRQLHKLVIKV